MPVPSPHRRTAALLAASSIGLSGVLLSATGVASAAPTPTRVTTDLTLTVPDGTCSVDLLVVGAAGGSSADFDGGRGASVSLSYAVTAGHQLYLSAGPAGDDAADGGGGAIWGVQGGGGGGTGAGGGGSVSWLYDVTDDMVLVSAAAGGGAGTGADGGDGGGAGSSVGDAGTTTWAAGGQPGDPGVGGLGGDHGADAVNGTNGEDGWMSYGGNGAANGGGGGGGGWYGGGGGAAADTIGGAGGGGGSTYVNTAAAGLTLAAGQPSVAAVRGDGYIDYTLEPCTAPGAPVLNAFADQTADGTTVAFYPATDDPAQVAPATGWEYTFDAGTTWSPLPSRLTGGNRHEGTLPPLLPQHHYSVAIRAQSAVGPSAPSRTIDVYRHMNAPASVGVAVGTSSVTLTWTPPVGATGIVGYSASVIPVGEGGDDMDNINCPDMDASARSCTIAVPAGTAYTAYVQAYDAVDAGFGATADSAVVPGPPVPATLPAASGPLGSSDPDGVVAAGAAVTVSGDGFAPYSTVQLVAYSTPVSLGTGTADDQGRFSAAVTVPAGLVNGVHHLVATGIDPSGATRNLVVEVTVTGGRTAAASGGTGSLAYTGFAALPWLLAGLVALAVGTGLVVVGRRRRTA